jgi:serine/threonine protein kinase
MKQIYDWTKVPKEVGKGAFGYVVVTNCLSDPSCKVAIKIMNKEEYQIDLEYLDDEIAILNQLDHPNIVKYMEKYEDD